MDTLTYSAIIGVVFILGIFVFTYFESPRNTFNKGIKKVKEIQFLKMNQSSGKTALTIPSGKKQNSKGNSKDDLRIYVHEY